MKILTREETVIWYNNIVVSCLRGEKPKSVFSGAMAKGEDVEYAADLFRKRFVDVFSKIPENVISKISDEQEAHRLKDILDEYILGLERAMEAATESIKDRVSNVK